jgi:hypothetical protein
MRALWSTALRWNVDELHTFDRDDLIALNGQIDRADGKKLIIGKPPNPPTPPGPGPLFEGLKKASNG